ncbi:uncharacterized protein ZK1073.1 [Dermatophagoides farinae]|uniref:uncharacterized protein ZK1073.1 n=1 Tax=Dermatophagoides farinae TaxID=6954 RepID=UPI001F1144FD|nr:uncharacterized protein ZK1073.1-like [Dermatophagoides farinae]
MNRRGKAYRGDAETQDEDQLMEFQFEIKTDICGYLNVFVKGDIDNLQPSSLVFLTVHDLGTNHEDFHKLLEHPCMARVKQRSIWIHVDMPGQEYDAIDLPPYFDFPTFDQISEDLVQILDYFNIESCLTFGEGAGANILLRMAMNHPDRVMGNILIHCRATVDNHILTYFEDKYNLWRLRVFGMNTTTDNFLIHHKFGLTLNAKKDLDTEQSIKQYLEQLHKRINPKNLRPFIRAYLKRSNIATKIKNNLVVPSLIVAGSYPTLQQMADEMQILMDKKIVTRWNAANCASILDEATDLLTNKLILFCQGLGYFSTFSIVNRDPFNLY